MPDPDESGGAAPSGEGTPLAVADAERRLEDDTDSAEDTTELGSPSGRVADDSPDRADIGPDSGRPDLLDPRRDLNETMDPRATMPEGVEMPNALVDPLTGEALDTSRNHFGISTDQAGIDSSALDDIIGDALAQHDGETGGGGVTRNPQAPEGDRVGSTKTAGSQEDTLGGTKGGGSEQGKGSSGQGGAYPGGRNWDLVSDEHNDSSGNTKKGYLDGLFGGGKKEGPTADEQLAKRQADLGVGGKDGGTPVIPEYKDPKKKMGDPDAVDPSTAPIELPDHLPADEISKTAGVDGVEPEEPDSEPTVSDRYSKFVNPNPTDSGIDTTVAPGTAPPNPGNVDPVNPRDGLDPPAPEVPEGPGGPVPGGTGQALTATPDGAPSDSSVQLVDEDAGSGIQSVAPEPAPDATAGHAVPTDPLAESDPITAATEPLMAEVTESDFEEPAFTDAPGERDGFEVEGDTPDFDGDGVPG